MVKGIDIATVLRYNIPMMNRKTCTRPDGKKRHQWIFDATLGVKLIRQRCKHCGPGMTRLINPETGRTIVR